MPRKIAITGGGGYVGAMLVPRLLAQGHEVTVLDTFWYGQDVFPSCAGNPRLRLVKGDIRSYHNLMDAFRGADTVIHLACISNDPSFEMTPELGKTINYDSFAGIIKAAKENNVKRFVYASSSSVYGVKPERNVTEEMSCNPLTDYSKYKLMCEEDLKDFDCGTMEWVIVRPATVCGWSPRLRLDLTVNILTISALVNKKIKVHGGSQLRPNINIKDMVEAYVAIIEAPREKVHGQTFNVGFENMSVLAIAKLVKEALMDPAIGIDLEGAIDNRSYHVNSKKIEKVLDFKPKYTLSHAVNSILLSRHKLVNPLTNPIYYNVRRMKELGIG